MNCCDEYGECNQGRNCPARAAKVAKVGRRYQTQEELPPTLWRLYVKHLAKWLLILCVGVLIMALLMSISWL